MKKLLSVLMVASMVSLVACKGGKKNDDAAKHDADSIENARVQDSIAKATATPAVDTTAKDTTAKPAEGEMKKEEKKEEKQH